MKRSIPRTLALAGVACASAFAAAAAAVACSEDDAAPPPPRAACVPPARRPASNVTTAPAPPFGDAAFESPVEIGLGPGGPFYVLEQPGVVKLVPPEGGAPTVALDLRARVKSGGEAGLLGIAFDPVFRENGFVYLHFNEAISVRPGVVFQSVIARFKSNDGGLTIDAASEKRLLVVDQPFANHNGGKIAFGPDGFLYIALGDGGSGGDPQKNGQNKDVLLGKILRIDPRGGDPYAIPPGNPFATGGGRPEIYAYGLRNPWKLSFDSVTGELWCADVGQSKFEEIDLIVAGGNFGWSVREGKHCYPPGSECSADGFVDPVFEYGRTEGGSVSGGYVYRGTKIPALFGKYVYGDFTSGRIWALEKDAAGQFVGALLADTELLISTFAQGADGEIWVADYATGKVHALVLGEGAAPAEVSGTKLSETGCVDVTSPARAPAGLVAYDVNSPLWSDGAPKERWLFVPEGKKIGVRADGDFDVPPGSVAVKTFTFGGKRVETRLFVRHDDGAWAGYSYEWNDEETEAFLLETGKTKDVPGAGTWTFPSRAECFACHTASAGFTLGLEARQLNREVDGENLLDRFAPLLERPIAKDAFLPVRAADAPNASVEERARGYLHANCSICHREGTGTGAATMDLRIDRSLADMRICNATANAGDLAVPGAKIVTPGDPSRSVLTLRMRALDQGRMPPLATRVVDETGASAVEAWIRALSCP